MTLVFSAGLAAAAVAFIEGRRSDGLAMRAQVQAVEAEALLESSLQQTAALLANRSERQLIPGSLNWRMGSAQVRVVIESEAGKIDLNGAEETLLESLPLALGVNEDRAAAFAQTILDWRDDNAERHNLGAEDRDYDLAERGSSGAADRPMAHPGELRYLQAVDRALWARLAPLVTVYSGSGSPNRTKAPEPVRRAMAIARGLAADKDAADGDAAGEEAVGEGTSGEEGLGDGAGAEAGSTTGGLSPAGESGPGLSDRSSAGSLGDESAGTRDRGFARGGLGSGGTDEADATEAAGTSTGEAAGAHTVLLDVRFPNGYEAAARAVIGFPSAGQGSQSSAPFVVLDWTPILREQVGTP